MFGLICLPARRLPAFVLHVCIISNTPSLGHMYTSFSTLVFTRHLAEKHKLETEHSPSVGLGKGFELGKLAFLSGSVVPHHSP